MLGLHIAGLSQSFEYVLGLVVHHSAATLFRSCYFKFLDDFANARGIGRNRLRDANFTQRAEALAISSKVKRNQRNIFALDIAPDVKFGPMQQGMDA